MPICGCGCEQTLGRRQVKRHMETKVIPCLVTAAVAQFWTLGTSVSAPRLEHSKKRRSSRRYIPSSPEAPEDDEPAGPPPVDISDDGMNVDKEEKGDVDDDEQEVQRIIGRSQQGIWSGRHHMDDEEDESDDGDESDESGEGSEGDGYGDWEVEEGLENSSGLSALDRIGEDFERNATVNGELSCPKWPHDTTKACIYRWKTW
jgi:hypothetical protein